MADDDPKGRKQDVEGEGKEIAELNPASGNIVTVDRTLFFELVRYFAENNLVSEFEDFLESNDCYELLLDVAFANLMKQFLVRSRRTDPTARLAVTCSCGGPGGGGGGGGGSPSGVRG